MTNDLKIISVSNVFDNINYLVPIYQRNFAWTETQIVQLIEDVESSARMIIPRYNEMNMRTLLINVFIS